VAEPGAQTPSRGLLIDWGGVLTSSLFDSFAAFCRAEGLEIEELRAAFREQPAAREALIEMETGRIDEAEFEMRLAAILELRDHRGLVDRMFAGIRPDEDMVEAVARIRAAGVRTCLVSNSWGPDRYDRYHLDRLFDATVISALEGTRKPDPRMYELAIERIGVPPAECVFVDDLPFNLPPAEAMGIATVLHHSAAETIPQLERLFGVSLAA
jgi:putative hydrolase of the HAD superfamily